MQRKTLINLLAVISIILGVITFIVGLITISIGYNIVISALLLLVGLIISLQSSLLFTYPHNKLYQQEKLREWEWKFSEATKRVNALVQDSVKTAIEKAIIEEVKKEFKEDKSCKNN